MQRKTLEIWTESLTISAKNEETGHTQYSTDSPYCVPLNEHRILAIEPLADRRTNFQKRFDQKCYNNNSKYFE